MELQELLAECAKRKASDLHLKAGSRPILRIHGHLEVQDDLAPISHEFVRRTAMTLLGEHRFGMLMEGKEMDVGYLLPGLGRFRVNMFLSQGEVRGVFRHVPQRIPAFQELHMPKVLDRLCMERRGLILVTGITGSGKSTTLAAIVDFVNKNRNDHILTIEDPIEFVHEDNKCVISQREIGQDSVSFATALRAALREDPDIILVGEMRDAETMEVALHAAETGHLVLSTLHTLNATETINRIISTFPPHQEDQIRDQLASVMQGIVSQRLVVRADGKGRVPAVEVMVGTGLIRDSIRASEKTSNIPTVIAAGQAQYGMQTFDQSLLQLHREELITYETARDAATNPDDFDLKVKGILSTGEMTWDAASVGAVPPPAGHDVSFARRGGEQPLPEAVTAPGRRSRGAVGERPTLDAKAARRAAVDLLARKAWSRRELTRRLERRGAPADVAAEVVAELAARGYLDDEGFARWWAQARGQGRRVGSMRLRQELLAKGISRELAAAAVAAAFAETPELDRALDAGRRRLAALSRASRGRVPARLADYLLRRGYPPSVAARVVRALLAGAEDAEIAVPDSADDDGGG